MTMKLPIILSAMIAALAIPGSIASEADAAKGSDAAPAAEAAAPEAAAPEAGGSTEAAPAAEEKKATAKKKRRHHGGKHHKGKKRRYADGSGGHVADVWDLPYDYAVKEQGGDSSGCSGGSEDPGKRLPNEEPGYPGPNVPRGM